MNKAPVVVPDSWRDLDLASLHGVLLVVGAPDTGKSTFVHWLCGQLSACGKRTALLDGDVGQSILGPPATLTLALPTPASETVRKPGGDSGTLVHWFVGDVSPRGRMLPLVVGAGRLAARALEAGAVAVIVDTTGLVDPAQGGVALKHALVDQLQPTTLFSFQRVSELEPILTPLRNLAQQTRENRRDFRVVELPVAAAVRRRDVGVRQTHRADAFRRYFAAAGIVNLSTDARAVFDGRTVAPRRLLALQDAAGFTLALGVIVDSDQAGYELIVRTPLTDVDAVASIRLGAIGVDADTGREIRPGRGL